MDKKQIIEKIGQVFPQSIVNPINPFTVDNPDVLVFNGRTLKGLFFPLAKELNNPDLLLRRLFLSRLSLCKTVSNVLVLSNESVSLTNNIEVVNAFDRVYEFEDCQDMSSFLKDDISQRHILNPQLRRVRMRRFWGLMDYIEKNGIEKGVYDNSYGHYSFNVKSWSNPDKKRYNKSTEYKHPILVTSKDKTKQSFKESFEDIMTVTTMFNYSLSDGVFASNSEALDTFMFLNVETIETVIGNSMNMRTLAFLGYLPGRVSTNFNMDELWNKYYAFMKERKYW